MQLKIFRWRTLIEFKGENGRADACNLGKSAES